jgi:hypothetical protein
MRSSQDASWTLCATTRRADYWPIGAARLKPPTGWQRWRFWGPVAVELEFATPVQVDVPDVVSRLAEVLLDPSNFEHDLEDPEDIVRSLKAARTPQELIDASRPFVGDRP